MADVLIVGAGPTGLVLALWLTRQGIGVRIIDKSAGPGETSRALAVQARTLELYRQVGLADAVVAAGHRVPAMNVWARGRHRARVVFGDAGADVSPYPFVLVYPQDHHERLLVDALQALGVTVERNTELLGFDDTGGAVAARLRLPGGGEQTATFRFLAGCDGARSTVRHALGTGFEGGTYKHVFYVADVELGGLDAIYEGHLALDGGDFILVLPYDATGKARLVGTVKDERADHAESLAFEDVDRDAAASLGLRIDTVHWFSTYRVHHRVADAFRQGRAFLLGDAAHIHSPAGGQGMNTGILDAINLSWKLAHVLQARAPEALLDSYAIERMAFARTLVDTTDRAFTVVTSESRLANFVKTYVAPQLASLAYRFRSLGTLLFETVSQTTLDYRDSPVSSGQAGEVRGGDRLPWVEAAGADNFAPLPHIGWQLHVYGTAPPDLAAWCSDRGVALRAFAWNPAHGRAGLARDAAYLVRPDGYVGLAAPSPSPAVLDRYFATLGYRH